MFVPVSENAINYLTSADPNFSLIIDTYGIPNQVVRPQGFETLCKIIFEQQVSLESARACYDKLNSLVSDFTPQNVLQCSEADFRQCGLSRQKATYITALADAIVSQEIHIERFPSMTADEVRAELIKIKGIGNWTIDVYLMFSLQFPDIMPLADIGIIVTIKELWGIADKEEARLLTQSWSPFRTAAAFFLWGYYLKKRGRKIEA
ncbi:MAG TPA: DNA-3-methyladenine glycosylase 2 family protein [Flavobacterium sp.]|jgi:DNA-3-methyladenine glycosylase II